MQIFSGMRSNSSRDSKRDPCVCVCSLQIPFGYNMHISSSCHGVFILPFFISWSMKKMINSVSIAVPFVFLAVCLDGGGDEIIN